MNNFYIPSELINSDNLYSYKDNIITVYSNCENNNCTCNDVYVKFDYNYSEDYSCTSNSIHEINGIATNEIYYRYDFWNILFIFLCLCFIIIYCPLHIVGRFFKRFEI